MEYTVYTFFIKQKEKKELQQDVFYVFFAKPHVGSYMHYMK